MAALGVLAQVAEAPAHSPEIEVRIAVEADDPRDLLVDLCNAALLEAEVVTADGTVRIANHCTHPDLFWGLKGGGGGSLGVVTRLTLRTHSLPDFFGAL